MKLIVPASTYTDDPTDDPTSACYVGLQPLWGNSGHLQANEIVSTLYSNYCSPQFLVGGTSVHLILLFVIRP